MEQETGDEVEGVTASKMAAIVQAVEFLQPTGWLREQIPDAGDVVR